MDTLARDLLRDLWRHGVRVHLLPDRFRLEPSSVAPEPLRVALREYADAVAAILAELPAPSRCRVCGEPSRRPIGPENHCVTCAMVVADRRGWRVFPAHYEEAA